MKIQLCGAGVNVTNEGLSVSCGLNEHCLTYRYIFVQKRKVRAECSMIKSEQVKINYKSIYVIHRQMAGQCLPCICLRNIVFIKICNYENVLRLLRIIYYALSFFSLK